MTPLKLETGSVKNLENGGAIVYIPTIERKRPDKLYIYRATCSRVKLLSRYTGNIRAPVVERQGTVLKITLAKESGFCFGVRDAVKMAHDSAIEHGKVYMLGDIVHNEHVVRELDEAGVEVMEKLESLKEGPVLFRAHGTPTDVWAEAERKGLQIIDATCPLVTQIHNEAKELESEGRKIIIIGDHGHDEVVGIASQVKEAIVISKASEVKPLGKIKRAGVVSQSTQTIENVQEILNLLIPKVVDLRFINTICFPTNRNQEAIKELASTHDVMIIIGSYTSANTKRLTSISRGLNPNTHQVETAADLRTEWFEDAGSVGVSAGASTPDFLIDKVIEKLGEMTKAAERAAKSTA